VQPLQSFSMGVLAEIIRRQPSSKERTAFAWQMAVGSSLARVTVVDLADRVLTVRAIDPRWATEIERARAIILPRLQHLLGPDAVASIVTRS
jgi:hypothetical protein